MDTTVLSIVKSKPVAVAPGVAKLRLVSDADATKYDECTVVVTPVGAITLPGGLTLLDAESLSGTGVTVVVDGGSLRTIGSKAFAACPSLAMVVLDANVQSIATDAFEGCPEGLVLVCTSGSAAETFAKQHDMAYLLMD